MSIEWAATIDATQLREYFGEAVVARGIQCRHDGRVESAHWNGGQAVLVAQCRGSAHERYECTVEFERVGVRWEIAWVECTCPVTQWCKHGVAALLTFAAFAQETDSVPDWESQLAALLTDVDAGRCYQPLALVAECAESSSPYAQGSTVTLHPATLGKRGTWIRTGMSWRHLLTHAVDPRFDPAVYAALREMARALCTDLYAAYHGSTMPLRGAPRSLWRTLDDATAAGVALVGGGPAIATVGVADASIALDFAADDARGGASIGARLVVYGEVGDAEDSVGLIGAPRPHGVFRLRNRQLLLARFDPMPERSLVELLTTGRSVHVPLEDVERFTVEALPRLSGRVPVRVPDGLFLPPQVEGPTPVLTVHSDAAGGTARWGIRYVVNDRVYDHPPVVPTQTAVGYRDPAAEETAWKEVADALALVAGVTDSWRTQACALLEERLRTRAADEETVAQLNAIRAATTTADAIAVSSLVLLRSPMQYTRVEVARLAVEILPQLLGRDDLIVDAGVDAAEFRSARAELAFGAPEDGLGANSLGNDWFDLAVTVTVAGEDVPLVRVFTEIATGATHMLLPSGTYFPLDTPELTRLRELIEEAQALGELESGRVNSGSHNVTLWEELLSLGVVDAQVRAWQTSLQRMSAARPPESIAPPAALRAELREYQLDGLNWLAFLWDNGFGGILADDMGLGKTLQALALFCRVREQGGTGPFLVVAPTSVVNNWAAECAKFAPDLTAVPVTSTVARGKVPIAELAVGADVVITSYTLLRIDFEHYAGVEWAAVVLDEAQFVKNHNAKVHQCARRLSAPFKLAITGTPMENNLLELWALLSITAPGLFPRPQPFTDYYRKPIESGQDPERLHTLRRRMKPMMLRRTKDQVASDLPPKQEQTLTLDLVAKHRKLYDTRLARERQKVLGLLGDFERNRFEIFRSLTMLRQLSLHAGLVDEADLGVASAKVEYLTEQLPGLVAEGHSALVFSQFTGFLALLREALDAVGIEYCYLDGSMSARARQREIKRFTGGERGVFLISLKAGGFGLNLTEADYCFLCDPWWNPAAEAQAVDRAHRIGQTRPVTVYRLVAAGTIEGKVVGLQERKRELFNAVIDDGDMFGTAITESDIRDMLA